MLSITQTGGGVIKVCEQVKVTPVTSKVAAAASVSVVAAQTPTSSVSVSNNSDGVNKVLLNDQVIGSVVICRQK